MIDYRKVYLFRIRKRGSRIKAKKVIAVTLPFASWHERRLHKHFASDRYRDVRKIPKHQYLQRIYKIGIAKDPDQRLKQFERKPESGKTETFAFWPSQAAEAKTIIRGYYIRYQIIRWAAICGGTLAVFWLT